MGVAEHEADRTSFIEDVTQQLGAARLDPEGILTTVIQALSRLRPGTWVASLINKDGDTVRVVAANHRDPQLARYVEDMHGSGEAAASTIATEVIETGRPILLPGVAYSEFLELLRADVRTYLEKHSPPVNSPLAHIAALVVPMRARGAVVGTIGLFSGARLAHLSDADVGWLQAVADRAGAAAENAQLYEDAVRRLKQLNALSRVAAAVTSSSDLRLTLQVVLDQLAEGLDADAADVLLLDAAGTALTMAARKGFQSTSVPEYRLPLDDHPPGRAIITRQFETATEPSQLARFRRRTLFAREGFRAYSVAPLVVSGRALGVLEAFQRTAFTPDGEWIGFLETVAAFAAVAVDAAVAHEQLQSRTAPAPAETRAQRLTALERQVLGLLVEGTTNAAIAEALHISQSTVKFHVRQMLQKSRAGNRTELARLATREGWL